jgi:hypothetical protein
VVEYVAWQVGSPLPSDGCHALVQEVVLAQELVEPVAVRQHDKVFVGCGMRRKIEGGTAGDCHSHLLYGGAKNRLPNMSKQVGEPIVPG